MGFHEAVFGLGFCYRAAVARGSAGFQKGSCVALSDWVQREWFGVAGWFTKGFRCLLLGIPPVLFCQKGICVCGCLNIDKPQTMCGFPFWFSCKPTSKRHIHMFWGPFGVSDVFGCREVPAWNAQIFGTVYEWLVFFCRSPFFCCCFCFFQESERTPLPFGGFDSFDTYPYCLKSVG